MEQQVERMYARTWRATVADVPTQDAIDTMVDVLLPEVAAMPGYCGATLLLDRNGCELVATIFWDTLEHLQASSTRETNAATGAFVLAAGVEMVGGEHEVVLNVPAPAVSNRTAGGDA